MDLLYRGIYSVLNVGLAGQQPDPRVQTEDERKHYEIPSETHAHHAPHEVHEGKSPLEHAMAVVLKGSFADRYWGDYHDEHTARASVPKESLFPFFHGGNGSAISIDNIPFFRVAVKVYFKQKTPNARFEMVRSTYPHYLKFTSGSKSCSLDRLLADTLFDAHSTERLPSDLLTYDEMREYHEAQEYAKYALHTYGLIAHVIHNTTDNALINHSVLAKYREKHDANIHEKKFFSKTMFPTADDKNVNAAVAIAHALVAQNTLHVPTLQAIFSNRHASAVHGYGGIVAAQEHDIDALTDAARVLCTVTATGGMVGNVNDGDGGRDDSAAAGGRTDYVLDRVLPFVGADTSAGRAFVDRRIYATVEDAAERAPKVDAFCRVWATVFSPYLLRRAVIGDTEGSCEIAGQALGQRDQRGVRDESFDNARYLNATVPGDDGHRLNNVARIASVLRAAIANPAANKFPSVDKFVDALDLHPAGRAYDYMTNVCSTALVLTVNVDPNDVMFVSAHSEEDAGGALPEARVSPDQQPAARTLCFRIPLDYIHYLCVHGMHAPSNYIIPPPTVSFNAGAPPDAAQPSRAPRHNHEPARPCSPSNPSPPPPPRDHAENTESRGQRAPLLPPGVENCPGGRRGTGTSISAGEALMVTIPAFLATTMGTYLASY